MRRFAVFAALAAFAPLSAWGPEGHSLVARIAEAQLTPAAAALVNEMNEAGVLLATDGPLHNVIKIKPPMIFSRADADFLLERLDTSLARHVRQ